MKLLTDKYRPNSLDEVIGQRATIDSIERMLTKETAQCFLLSGIPGVGKTSILRIIAKMVKARVIEVQGATHSGVDNMRELVETITYGSKSAPLAILIDECHRLSAQAWDAILKVTEEPKPGQYWLLSTTDLKKVPKAIQTRFACFGLNGLSDHHLGMLVEDTATSEKMDVFSDIVDLCVDHAGGSARQALQNLAKVEGMSVKEAEQALMGADTSADVIDLINALRDAKGWGTCMAIMQRLKDQSPEGIRVVVSNYMGKVAMNASGRDARDALVILRAFRTPYNTSEGFAPLMLSIDDCMKD